MNSFHLINKVAYEVNKINEINKISIFSLIVEFSNKYNIDSNLLINKIKIMFPVHKDLLDWADYLQKNKRSKYNFQKNKVFEKKKNFKKVKLKPRK